MRKTSQDGGDSSSITSGFENDIKRPGAGILKSKRNSIKRKVQSLSHESDDAVIEPLLQRDKEKTDVENQSAKYTKSKSKTDYTSTNNKGNDTDKLLADKKVQKPSISNIPTTLGASLIANGTIGDSQTTKSHAITTASMHNHMNTNVFYSQNGTTNGFAPKSQILVEIGGSQQSSYNPSSLIFTTAKIHADGISAHMQQVTPVPILSTVEGSVVKVGSPTDSDKNIIGSRKDNNSSIVYSKSATSDLLVMSKNQISTASYSVVNNTPPTDGAGNNIINVTSSIDHKTDSTHKTTAINSSSVSFSSQQLISTNKETSKMTPRFDSSKDIIEGITKSSDKQIEDDHFKTLLPQTAHSSTSVTSKITDLDKGLKSETEDISKNNITPDYMTTNNKTVVATSKECNMDINKNIETSSQKPVISKDTKTLVVNESISHVLDKNNKISSNTSNKQLQRQKNATTKDLKESNLKQNAGSGNAGQSIDITSSKSSNDSNDKLISLSKDQTKQSDSDLSNRFKNTNIVPKSNVNNVSVSKVKAVFTTIITATTVQSIASKPSVLNSATEIQPKISKSPLLTSTPFKSVTIKASVLGSTPTIQSITKKASVPGSTSNFQSVTSKPTLVSSATTVQPVTCKTTVHNATTSQSSLPYSTATIQLPTNKISVLSSTSSAVRSTPIIKPLVSTDMITTKSKPESKPKITTVQVVPNQSSVPTVKSTVKLTNTAKSESKPSITTRPSEKFKKSGTVSTAKPMIIVTSTSSVSKPTSSTKSTANISKSQPTSNTKPISGSVPSTAASKTSTVTTMTTLVTTASSQLITSVPPPLNSASVIIDGIEVTAICAPKTAPSSANSQ